MSNTISLQDERGRRYGLVQEQSNGELRYMTAGGTVVAYVRDAKTYSAGGAYKGPGDQGMRLLMEQLGR